MDLGLDDYGQINQGKMSVSFNPNQNLPGVKKVATKSLKKAILKKMWNQNGRPSPPAVDGI